MSGAGVFQLRLAAVGADTSKYREFAASLISAHALVKVAKGGRPAKCDDVVSGGEDLAARMTPSI